MLIVLARLGFCAALALCFWFAFTPPTDVIAASDKSQHVAAFFTLTLLAAIGWPKWSAVYIALGLSALGVAIELVQMLPAVGRDGDWHDWVADLVGIASALVAVAIARRAFGRPQYRVSSAKL